MRVRATISGREMPECECFFCRQDRKGKCSPGVRRPFRPLREVRTLKMPSPLFDNPSRLPRAYAAYFLGGPMDGRVEEVHRKGRSLRPQLFLHDTEYVLWFHPTASTAAVYKDIEVIRHEQQAVR